MAVEALLLPKNISNVMLFKASARVYTAFYYYKSASSSFNTGYVVIRFHVFYITFWQNPFSHDWDKPMDSHYTYIYTFLQLKKQFVKVI